MSAKRFSTAHSIALCGCSPLAASRGILSRARAETTSPRLSKQGSTVRQLRPWRYDGFYLTVNREQCWVQGTFDLNVCLGVTSHHVRDVYRVHEATGAAIICHQFLGAWF